MILARFGLILLSLSLAAPAWSAVRVTNRQGTELSRNLPFIDDQGKPVTLEQYGATGKPTVLALVYYGCPGVCTVLLNSFVETMTLLGLKPGRDFELVAVSIHPDETPELARKKKESYLKLYGHPETRDGWHFLTGKSAAISELSRELGFEYERDRETGFFNHPSALFIVTPKGVLSSTLVGLKFSRDIVAAAILDASEGRLGNYFGRIGALCYRYMPHRGWLDRPERWFGALLGMLVAMFLAGWQWRRKSARLT